MKYFAFLILIISLFISAPAGAGVLDAFFKQKEHDSAIITSSGQGHLSSRHIGKSLAELAKRLTDEPHIPAASTFINAQEAEAAITVAINNNQLKIDAWVAKGARGKLAISANYSCGMVLIRGANQAITGSKVRLVLKGDGKENYFILTGYPAP